MGEERVGLNGRYGLMRGRSHRAVFERLAATGAASRVDLARDLALSPASVSRVVDVLLRSGLVRVGERVVHGVGRPQTMLHVEPRAGSVAGVSIRSTSLRVHLADLEGGPVAQTRVPRATKSPEALARQLRDVLIEMVREHAPARPLAAVAIGLSGVWDEVGGEIYAAPNLALLEGVDALALFRGALRGHVLADTVTLDNEVNFAALGEQAHGAARGREDFFYLSLGSGVGGAAVVGGHIQHGVHGFGGEIGYLPVQANGALRPLESVVGRKALERLAAAEGLLREDEDVFHLLEADGGGSDVIGRHVSGVLAQALAAIVTTLDPELIVLGGGVGRYSEAWTRRIQHHLGEYLPVVPEVVSTAMGREASLSGAIGAARVLARHALLTRELAA